jgi:hypothetical protein
LNHLYKAPNYDWTEPGHNNFKPIPRYQTPSQTNPGFSEIFKKSDTGMTEANRPIIMIEENPDRMFGWSKTDKPVKASRRQLPKVREDTSYRKLPSTILIPKLCMAHPLLYPEILKRPAEIETTARTELETLDHGETPKGLHQVRSEPWTKRTASVLEIDHAGNVPLSYFKLGMLDLDTLKKNTPLKGQITPRDKTPKIGSTIDSPLHRDKSSR